MPANDDTALLVAELLHDDPVEDELLLSTRRDHLVRLAHEAAAELVELARPQRILLAAATGRVRSTFCP
jgi:hypothetical protein